LPQVSALHFIRLTKTNRCDNHYVIEAKCPEQKGEFKIEFEMEKGHEHKMFKDDREKDRGKVLENYNHDFDDEKDLEGW
jgi:hypothetical protein